VLAALAAWRGVFDGRVTQFSNSRTSSQAVAQIRTPSLYDGFEVCVSCQQERAIQGRAGSFGGNARFVAGLIAAIDGCCEP
jgi:hypothetical protein